MTIVKSPLFTELYDKLGNSEFRRRRNRKIELAKKRVPSNPRTFKQRVIRKIYGQCVERYNQLTEEEKRAYAQKYRKENLDAYRGFMKECLKKNLPTAIYEVVIDNSTNPNELTDFQVLLNISGDSQFFQDCQDNPYAFYFMNEELTAKIPFYREEWDMTNYTAKIWLKVPKIPAEGKVKLYMLINPNRETDESNPNAVFDFWDDFETLDNWDVHVSKGNVRVENSLLILDGSNSATSRINGVRSKTTFSYPIAIDFKLIVTAPTTNWSWKMFGVFDTPLTAGHLFEGNNAVGRNQEGTPYFGTMKDGNSTRVDVDSITDWHVETIIWTDNKAQNLWDYQLKAEITENIPTVPLYIELGVGNNAGAEAIKCDWVRVRKFASPEPTVTYTKL